LRKFLIAVGVLLVLLVAAVLVGPSLVDWNTQKDRIVAEVREATGRDFSIDGDMSLSLLPVPALSAQGVRLASVEGGSEAPMLELKELRVRVAVLPLLQGTVQVERILLVEPKILLEVLPDGRRNWSFAEGSPEETAEGSAEGSADSGGGERTETKASDFDVRFDDVSVEKGTVIYRDATTGREERIDALDLRIVAESLEGPFAGKGSARVHGIDGTFEGTVGRMVEEGATPYNVVLKPNGEAARLQLSGAISIHPDSVSMRGHLKGEGDSLARLIDDVSGEKGDWPSAMRQGFAVQGELSLDPQAISVSELDLELGGFRLTGELTSGLAPPYDARLVLAAPQLDLDQMFESEASGAAPGGVAAGSADGAEDPPPAWVVPADAKARLELAVDALILRGQLIRQLRIDAALGEGTLQLERAMALLPGSSDISVSGSLREADGEAAFDGHLEAASDNLRGLLQWIGADVSAVPSDRLRRLSLSGQVTGSAKQIAINDIDLRLDQTRVSGGLVVAPRLRPGFGVGLALDSINLDAYLPNEAAAVDGTAGALQQVPEAGEQSAAAGLAVLDRFDANLNLRAGAVTIKGATVKDLQIDATLQRGAIEFRAARVGNLAGGELSYAGRVDDIATAPKLEGELTLSVDEPVRLAPLLGVEPDALVRLPALAAEVQVSGGLDSLAVDGQISGGGGRLDVAGSLGPAVAPLAFDLKLTGRHPDLATLLELAGRPLPAGSDVGVLDLALRVAGEPGRFQVSELEGALGPARLSGGFAVALDGARPAFSDLDLTIDAEHEDAARLLSLAGLWRRPPDGLGGLTLHARLNGGPAEARLDDLDASLGPLHATGAMGLRLDGAAPELRSFDLSVAAKDPDLARLAAGFGWEVAEGGDIGGLDLSARVRGDRSRMRVEDLKGRLGPVELAGEVSADLDGERPALAVELETGDLPLDLLGAGDIDLGALGSFDARMNLRATALTHDTLRLDRLALSAALRDGQLDLERLAGTLHGGTVQVTGTVDLREEIAASLDVAAVEVDLGELLRDQAGVEGVAGPVSFRGDLTTHGSSRAELFSALAGAAELSGLLTFEPRPGEGAGEGSGDPEESDLTGLLSRALGRDPVRLAGTVAAKAGRLTTEDTRLDGQPAYALTEAIVDLPDWTLEGVTEIYERSTGRPLISKLVYAGPLDAIQLEHAEAPPSPAAEPQAPSPAPATQAPSPAPEAQAPSPAPEAQEPSPPPATSSVGTDAAPAAAATAPEDGAAPAAAPSQPQPEAPVPAPKPTGEPASPPGPQPDDLLKDLLKLGS